VQKSLPLAAIQKEIHRHDLSYFVDNPPSVTARRQRRCRFRVPGMQKAEQFTS
jgi:hypothetical protein